MNNNHQTVTSTVAPPVFEVRALPRKRKPQEDEQPLFLRKVFHMIGTCPPAIGGWAPHGETFIIKNADKFAEEIIPTAFKHSKFSSFVRQLNFYGFRKVRPDAVSQAHWWEFRHPYFKRDEPELISKIKKSVHFDAQGQPVIVSSNAAAASGVVNGATTVTLSPDTVVCVDGECAPLNVTSVVEIEKMKNRMSAMETQIQDLTSMVNQLMSVNRQLLLSGNNNGAADAAYVTADKSLKKRKLSAVSAEQQFSAPPSTRFSLQVPEEQVPVRDEWEDFMMSKFADDSASVFELGVYPMTPLTQEFSVDSEDDLESLLAFDQQVMSPVPVSVSAAHVSPVPAVPVANASLLSSHPLSDPAAMVGMVDLMTRTLGTVASMCHTSQNVQTSLQMQNLHLQQQLQANGAACQCTNCKLLTSAASTASTSDGTSGNVQVPTVMVPLVAAALNALVAQYGDTVLSHASRVNTPAPQSQQTMDCSL